MLLLGRATIFVVFVIWRAPRSKALVFVGRVQIRHFRRFVKPRCFWQGQA